MSGIPAWARVGSKVICVDDAIHPERRVPGMSYRDTLEGLKSGVIYTIREVGDDLYHGVGIRLVEIRRAPNDNGIESIFHFSRFKPLITLEDDISTHFAALLDVKQPSPVSA